MVGEAECLKTFDEELRMCSVVEVLRGLRLSGRTDLAQVPSRFHGPVERAAELVSPTGGVRAVLLLDRRSFVVCEKVVVEAVVSNQTDAPLHCDVLLQQVNISRC